MTALPSPKRRLRFILAVLGLLAVVYVGSYYRLSRRGMTEANAIGMHYFFYCPLSDVVPYENFPRQHRILLAVCGPINQVDRTYFGGGTPCRGITWSLSK